MGEMSQGWEIVRYALKINNLTLLSGGNGIAYFALSSSVLKETLTEPRGGRLQTFCK
jgi:hypothetical protein